MAVQTSALFVATNGTVLAVDRGTGQTLWETDLKGSDYVDVMVLDGELFAASKGRLYKLDPASGDILWRNDLPGTGWGIVSIAGGRAAGPAEKLRQNRAADGAAVTAAASS